MKPRLNKPWASIAAILLASTVGWLAWQFLPASPKGRIIRAVPLGGSYSTYDRLAGMVKIGMTAGEVRAVLGSPESQQNLQDGVRWVYDEVDATTGWICVVDFTFEGGIPRLCYFCNVQHVLSPAGPHREFGNPVDGGKFDGEFLLRKRREEWHAERPPKL